jgi:hypothetical protein
VLTATIVALLSFVHTDTARGDWGDWFNWGNWGSQGSTSAPTADQVTQDYSQVQADSQQFETDIRGGNFSQALADLDQLTQDRLTYYSDLGQLNANSSGSGTTSTTTSTTTSGTATAAPTIVPASQVGKY